jgi:8-oxo-dGTP diphosphatase
MREKDRVGGVIIQDGKLLLVTGYDADYYWTPGGKIDDGENHKQALSREIHEELGVDAINPRFLTQMDYISTASGLLQTSYYYLVDFEGEIRPAQEVTGYRFFSAEEIPQFAHFVNDDNLLSKLLTEGLIW